MTAIVANSQEVAGYFSSATVETVGELAKNLQDAWKGETWVTRPSVFQYAA